MNGSCEHFATTTEVAPPNDVCESCIEVGSEWVHLRQCLVCGRTGCCDESENRHATRHFKTTGHALVRSGERGEEWAWCYPEELVFVPGPGGWELAPD
jgi:hypothetical protein